MADDQVKYGSIVVLHKDGPSPRPHSLKLGPTTIGSSGSSDIRVKTILSRTVQCIITTKDNGLVTIENKSKAHPVFLNGAVLKALEVLIHGDKFEVAGRAFQYINDQQKNRKDLMGILEKSSVKRQTTAAVMASSSKIPVSLNSSRIPVKKKRSLSLSETKENKRTTLTRLCATASTSKRAASLALPAHGLRKVLFDETVTDQCGPSPFLALNMRTRRSQSLTDRSLSQDLTSSHSTSIKLGESVIENGSPSKSSSLSVTLSELENKPKTPKTPRNSTLTGSSARKSMKKISEECGIENETMDLIDFDVSNVEGLPLRQNEEAQLSDDAKVSTPQGTKSGLKSPLSNSRAGRSLSRTPVSLKSPIKPTSTAVETSDRRHLSVDKDSTLVHELSQSLSEVDEEFVSPQKDDQDSPQEEDEIPSPNYEVISPNTNGFGTALVETLDSKNVSIQPVTDDDSTFFTPADNTLNNSNKSDTFQLQLETSTGSLKKQSLVQSPPKNRKSTSKSTSSIVETSLQGDKSHVKSKPQTPTKEKRRNSGKRPSSLSTADVNQAVEETLTTPNKSLDSNSVSVVESIGDSSAFEASTPKWINPKTSTAVFTRSGRKCSLPLKFREFQSVSSTPKSAVKKSIVDDVILEASYEVTVPASEASLTNTDDNERTDDVLKNAPVSDARAKSLTPVRAKTRLDNKSLPLFQAADYEESISSLPKELELSSQRSIISVSDVSQNDSVPSDANNSVIFNPISTPSANKLPASSYKTPPSVQISVPKETDTLVKENKSVRFSDTYVPKPRTPITRLKIRSLTPASAKTRRLNKSMPVTATGLSSVAENLEDSVSQIAGENTEETLQTPPGSARKSNRMSVRKTPKETSVINILEVGSTFGEESCVSQQGETEEEKEKKSQKVPQTPSSADKKSGRMSSRKSRTTPKETSVVNISDAEASTLSENEDAEESSSSHDKVASTPHTSFSSSKGDRVSSRKSAKTLKNTSVVSRTDSVAEASSFFGKDPEESNGGNEVAQTPQTSFSTRKSARMSSRISSTPKETSVFNISDTVAEGTSFSENGNVDYNNEDDVEGTPQTSVSSRKSARMSSRKSSKTQKEMSVVNISDTVAEGTSFSEDKKIEGSNNENDVGDTSLTSFSGRKSARKSSKTPKEASVFNISDTVAEGTSFSENENIEESNNEGDVEETSISNRKSARMSSRKSSKTQKELSVVSLSDTFAEEISLSEDRRTEESNNESDVGDTPQTSFSSRKSGRMSSRKSSKTPKEASVLNISDTVADGTSFSENGNIESNNECDVEGTPQTSVSSRKSARKSSRIQKEMSVVNISDTVAEETSLSEDKKTEESNNESDVGDTPQTSFSSRKSARMSSRKSSRTPKDASVFNITDTAAEETSFSQNGKTEEPNYEGDTEQTPQTLVSGRKSARMSSRKSFETPKEVSVVNIFSTSAGTSFSENGNTEESNNEGDVEETPQTSVSSRKSARMSSRKSSKTSKETSVFNISDTVVEGTNSSENGNIEESNNEGDIEDSISSRKSARMSSRKSSKILKDTSIFNISDTAAEETSFSENGKTKESSYEGDAEQTPQTSVSSRKSARMSSRKSLKTPKEVSVVNISGIVAAGKSFTENGDAEESNNESDVEETSQTSSSSRRISLRKSLQTPKQISVLNISDTVGDTSGLSEIQDTEGSNNESEVEQTPQTSISSRKSARMSSRKSSKITKETSVVNISSTEEGSFPESEITQESNNEDIDVETPQTSTSSRKSARMSSRKSFKTPKEMSVVNISENGADGNSFSEGSNDDGEVEQKSQTSFSSRKSALMSPRKTPRKLSIVSKSDIGDTVAADYNYKAEDTSNNKEESIMEQQTPHTPSSPRKSIRTSSIINTSDVANNSKPNDSVINLRKNTPLANVRHVRAKSHTPGIVKVHSTRKRSLPLLQKTLKKVALAANTSLSAKLIGKTATPVIAESSEKEHTPARKSLKRVSAEIVNETLQESPGFVQPSSQETAARKSSRISKKKSISDERTPVQHLRGTKRARETPATIQSRKRRKLDQSTENASMNSFCEEPSINQTPEFERPHKPQKSPLNDLTEVTGVKQLMKTPRYQKPPLNDLSDIRGVKKLLATPKIAKSPENDLTKVTGVKRLMKTPKPMKSPLNDLRKVKGLKQLMRTPRVQKSPENDLQQVAGVKQMFASPKPSASPLNDLTNVDGVKDLMRLQNLPCDDLTNVEGVDVLFAAPQRKSDEIFDSLFDKKQLKTYQRKSFPSHVLGASKSQRASSANQASCSPRVNQWVEESLQHLEKIKLNNKVNFESSKSGENVGSTEIKRLTPLRTSRGKLPSRYLETDYVFAKATPTIQIVKPDVENIEIGQNVKRLASKVENQTEERVTRKQGNRADEEKSDQVSRVHFEAPRRVTRKTIQSNLELKSKTIKEPAKAKSDTEVTQEVARNKSVNSTTASKVLKNNRTAKKNVADSVSSGNEEMAPPRSMRAAKKDARYTSQKLVANTRIVKKSTADSVSSENEEMAPPRSTRKAAEKEALKGSTEEPKDAPKRLVANKRTAKKNAADSVSSEIEERAPSRSTRKAAKKYVAKDSKEEPKDAPQRSVANRRRAKSAADSVSSENKEPASSRSTRKVAKDVVKDPKERKDAPQRSVTNKRTAKTNAADSENEELLPPRSTRKVPKKDAVTGSKKEPKVAPQRSVANKRTAQNFTDSSSENEEMPPPRSTRKAANKKETPRDSNDEPQTSMKNKKIAKMGAAGSGRSENEETTPPRSTRKAGGKKPVEDAVDEDVPQRSTRKRRQVVNTVDTAPLKRSKRNQEESEGLLPPAPIRSSRLKQTKETPVQKQLKEREEKMKSKTLSRSTRNKKEEPVESEPSESQKRTRRPQNQQDNKSSNTDHKEERTTRRRKQEVEDAKQKGVKIAKVPEEKLLKSRATRKQTATDTKVQTTSQPRAAREKLQANTRSTRSSKK